MSARRISVLLGACLALVLSPAGAALAAGTKVSVRVEGAKRTLLPATVVHTHAGQITKGGTPAGACPATSAAGALDVATKHDWSGTYGTYGLSVDSVFGERYGLKSADYWSIWVDNRYATAGICGLKLHRGEKLLFAAVSVKGSPYPLVISAPRHGKTGHAVSIKVGYVSANGHVRGLAGAELQAGQKRFTTGPGGTVSLTPAHAGRLVLRASKPGMIRAAARSLSVS